MLPELTTERLLLRQIEPEDQQFIFEGLSHPDVIPFFGVRYDSFEASAKQMEWHAKAYEEDTGASWKLIERASGKKMGVVSYYLHKHEHKKAEVGFWIFPEYWNKGFTSEALNELIRYCKDVKDIHRLEAFVETGNGASSKVLEKAGFEYEGLMRECEIKDGKFISLLVYAKLL